MLWLCALTAAATRVHLSRPSEAQMDEFAASLAGRRHNHGFVGVCSAAPGAEGLDLRVIRQRVHLGTGRQCWRRARRRLLEWQMHEGSSWSAIRVHEPSGGLVTLSAMPHPRAPLVWVTNPFRARVGSCYADHAPTLGASAITPQAGQPAARGLTGQRGAPADAADWRPRIPPPCRLRCRVVQRAEPGGGQGGGLGGGQGGGRGGGGRRTVQAGYATLEGHLIAGEERMSVSLHPTGEVTFEVVSYSRGAGPLGRILFVGLEPAQRRFFREQCRCMQAACCATGDAPPY